MAARTIFAGQAPRYTLPSSIGASGQFLYSDGTDATWANGPILYDTGAVLNFIAGGGTGTFNPSLITGVITPVVGSNKKVVVLTCNGAASNVALGGTPSVISATLPATLGNSSTMTAGYVTVQSGGSEDICIATISGTGFNIRKTSGNFANGASVIQPFTFTYVSDAA